jgi:hypothetical protein
MESAPCKFKTNRQKSIYAGTYLEKTPFKWFQTLLIDNNENWILGHYEAFEKGLKQRFGDPDERATNKKKLCQLKMRNNQEVQRYIVDICKYTPIIGGTVVLLLLDSAKVFQIVSSTSLPSKTSF